MPEVRGRFLVSVFNGKSSYEAEWVQAARRVATGLFNSLEAIQTGGEARLAAWEEGRDRVRQTARPRVVRNDMTHEEIAGELLKVMLSPYSFRDVTGLEVALSNASVDRLDPQGHHTLRNSRIVSRGVNLFRTDALDDRFLVEVLKRWKGQPFSSLFDESFTSSHPPTIATTTTTTTTTTTIWSNSAWDPLVRRTFQRLPSSKRTL
ncbi:hypothetical protein BCV69DRAFT_10349 [Microstroma glucosiphilum]|uniref:Uncharacterized protein n=1 Tax=Pseudomicrostroma glucosiphilum TaxID=1684307 RepID=A0A316UFS1_9BASI|nr:hypothetical protein BCV69DRAFT_10349 [Pseudomicrostroma glucosiphilum]PWN23788.1 hypothetical protein BCV69DRAFT_10349 [Pseudomicrostroma glucosiphilum]